MNYSAKIQVLCAEISAEWSKMVPQYTKDNLCSIIPLPIRREEYDTTQMILGILGHHGASWFPVSVPGFHREDLQKNGNSRF